MMKDEADIAPHIVEHMLTQVDDVYILDNNSTDGTSYLITQKGAKIALDSEIGYYQARKLTDFGRLLAKEHNVDWIIPFDADEYWYCPLGMTIKDILEDLNDQDNVVQADVFDYVATICDPDEENPLERIKWRRKNPLPLPKVAFRGGTDFELHQGNHDVTIATGNHVSELRLAIKHFPYRSVKQFIQKVRNGARAYAETDLPEDIGAHWRQYGDILSANGEEAVADIFREWFWSFDPIIDELVYDPV